MNNDLNQTNRLSRLKELGGAALIAMLLGSSMSLTVLDALAVTFRPWAAALISALTALVCAAVLLSKWTALISAVCVGGGLAAVIVRQGSLLKMLKETVVSLLKILIGGEGSLNEHAAVLLVAITIFFALIAFLMTRLTGGVYPAMLLYMFVMMGSWFLEERLVPLYAIPGLVALAVLYARAHRESSGYMKALPAALLAAVLAVTLLPAGEVTWAPLADAADKVRELFTDYFMFTDPRTVYSVSSDGYQPLGETLGGPAAPRDAEIMTVKTDRLLLMRGSVRRTYTGHSWVDNSFNSRYLFIDPTRQSLRDSVFDVDLSEALEGLVTEVECEVKMLNPGTSTLFVPHRLKSLSMPLDLVAYYNDSGEVFITRGIEYGDHYAFTAQIVSAGHEEINALVASSKNSFDPDYLSAQDSYMNLPAGLDNDVYWLTKELIADARTPYEKALAIQRHLLGEEYTYRLDVELPPADRDFVSYFLLDSKEGYCTYYASAMAVMARLAGLPSRYVEGYLVPAEPDGETLVTGENAHAWVEIYFEGIGWLPFDATPGEHSDSGDQSDTPPDHEPTPEPTPSSTPTPTPSPSPTPDRGDADDNDLTHDDATATPAPTPENEADDGAETTPTPEPATIPSEQPEAPADEDEQKGGIPGWIWLLIVVMILLVLLLIATLVIARWRATDPRVLSARQKSDKLRLMLWYRTVLTLLMHCGFIPLGGETPERFAERLVKINAAPVQLIDLARAVERQQYSRGAADPAAVKLAREVYERLIMQMKPAARMRWQIYRLTHGLGNYHQIP